MDFCMFVNVVKFLPVSFQNEAQPNVFIWLLSLLLSDRIQTWLSSKKKKNFLLKYTMSCSSTEMKQRLHIHSGESHKREFHGAWLTLKGFVRGRMGWRCRRGPAAHLLKEVDIFTRQAGVEVWNAWRGSHLSVCGSKAKVYRFTVIEGEDRGAGLLILRTVWSKYS